MKIGKVTNDVLERIIINPICKHGIKRNEVIIKPSVGEDCTAIDVGNELCVLSTDPITGAVEDIGKLAVHINANDIASSGAIPIGLMITLLLPPNTSEIELQKIMNGLYEETVKLNMEIMGGHTEVTDAVNKPVISCTVIGKTINRKFISSSGAKIGQDVVMTKFCGLEGTAIIANDYEIKLRNYMEESIIKSAKELSKDLSIIKEAMIASKFGVSCMHDVTEGGVYGACWEIASCSNVGIEIYKEKIPLLEQTKIICSHFQINPYRLISSGCLILSCYNAEELVTLFDNAGIKASIIGKIIEKKKVIIDNDREFTLSEPESDEIYKVR